MQPNAESAETRRVTARNMTARGPEPPSNPVPPTTAAPISQHPIWHYHTAASQNPNLDPCKDVLLGRDGYPRSKNTVNKEIEQLSQNIKRNNSYLDWGPLD